MADVKERALQMLRDGGSPAAVAQELGIPAATARTWKSRLGKPAKVKRNVSSVTEKVKRNETTETLAVLVDAVAENDTLTDAEKDFCLHYSYRPNASRAYRLANPGVEYDTARTMGARWFARVSIKNEINRLNRIKRAKMLETVAADEAQVFQMMWDIAFADMADYVEFGRKEVDVMGAFGPVQVTDPATGEKIHLKKTVNDVRFKESSEVDGTLLSEVKQGKDGASVKLADRMKALHWLTNYFEMNPSDVHKRDFDRRRLELQAVQIEASTAGTAGALPPDDGFLAALNDGADTWDTATPDDSQNDWKADDELDED